MAPEMLYRGIAVWRGVLRQLVVESGGNIKIPQHGIRAAQNAYALDDWMDELMEPSSIKIYALEST
jgi:hypothetical protein